MSSFANVPHWTDAEWLECVAVLPEVANCASFVFRAPSGAWFDYVPGQFLTLDLPVAGGNVQRTYTISSSPSKPWLISVTVKAQADSIGTRWMLDHLRPGTKLKAYGPAGEFSCTKHSSPKYLFISAGSGVTPMVSMSQWLSDRAPSTDITFIHAARSPNDIILRDQIERLDAQNADFGLHICVETVHLGEVWSGYRGRLSREMLGLMAPDFATREVFCCGPEPFMVAVRKMLEISGFDMRRYHQESFGPGETAAPAPAEAALAAVAAGEALTVSFAKSAVSAVATPGETVLSVAKRSGLNIPTGCTFGLCGTCKTRKLAGEVKMDHNGGISDEDINAGFILACCSQPLGAIELDL